MSTQELSWFIDDTLARALQAEQGVAQVGRVGGVDREINVIVDPDRMAAQGLTAAQVNNALRRREPRRAGRPRRRWAVANRPLRVLGAARRVEQLRDITIPTGGGRFVRLTDVADVGDGSAEVRGFAR